MQRDGSYSSSLEGVALWTLTTSPKEPSWTRPFWAECEEQFPRQGDLVFHNPIVALFCELFRLFEPELIREQTNTRALLVTKPSLDGPRGPVWR